MMTVEKLYKTLTYAEYNLSLAYSEIPILAIRMLLYIAYRTGRGAKVYVTDLKREFSCNDARVSRTVKNYMSAYIKVETEQLEGIKKPVNTFCLTSRGLHYVAQLVKSME